MYSFCADCRSKELEGLNPWLKDHVSDEEMLSKIEVLWTMGDELADYAGTMYEIMDLGARLSAVYSLLLLRTFHKDRRGWKKGIKTQAKGQKTCPAGSVMDKFLESPDRDKHVVKALAKGYKEFLKATRNNRRAAIANSYEDAQAKNEGSGDESSSDSSSSGNKKKKRAKKDKDSKRKRSRSRSASSSSAASSSESSKAKKKKKGKAKDKGKTKKGKAEEDSDDLPPKAKEDEVEPQLGGKKDARKKRGKNQPKQGSAQKGNTGKEDAQKTPVADDDNFWDLPISDWTQENRVDASMHGTNFYTDPDTGEDSFFLKPYGWIALW